MLDLDEMNRNMGIIRRLTGAIVETPAERIKKDEERLGDSYRHIIVPACFGPTASLASTT